VIDPSRHLYYVPPLQGLDQGHADVKWLADGAGTEYLVPVLPWRIALKGSLHRSSKIHLDTLVPLLSCAAADPTNSTAKSLAFRCQPRGVQSASRMLGL
jgi:hypothetical protein